MGSISPSKGSSGLCEGDWGIGHASWLLSRDAAQGHLPRDTSAQALFLMFWEIFRPTASLRSGLRKVQLFYEAKAQRAEHLPWISQDVGAAI
jgi:hypothetical protein